MNRRIGASVFAFAATASAASCKKGAPMTESPADAGMAPRGESDGFENAAAEPEAGPAASLDDMTARLDRLGEDLAQLSAEGASRVSVDEALGRCDRICEIAAATCELQGQICGLAAQHEGEPNYSAACDRAGAQCAAASDACARCRAP